MLAFGETGNFSTSIQFAMRFHVVFAFLNLLRLVSVWISLVSGLFDVCFHDFAGVKRGNFC